MRLLFLTNFFPPLDLGGWEQWCQEVANEFIARGHEVVILTSRFRRDRMAATEPYVYRELYLESDLYHYRPAQFFLNLPRYDRFNQQCLTDLVENVAPDAVVVWGMWQLNSQLVVLAEKLCPNRVAYYLCGFWPIRHLEQDPHTSYWLQHKTPLKWLALRQLAKTRKEMPKLNHAACVSQFVFDKFAENGTPLVNGRVIYGGIDLERFQPIPREWSRRSGPNADLPLRLLFAGSVSREKGVDTILQAMNLLPPELRGKIQLAIVGSGHPETVRQFKEYVENNRLEGSVRFGDRVAKEHMPALLQAHDVLLFSSAWEEPLARMMMEGMASGMVLISTTTGGSKEILRHDDNCLTFSAQDVPGLAAQIQRVYIEDRLSTRLAHAGRLTAETSLDFQRMADQIEEFVLELL